MKTTNKNQPKPKRTAHTAPQARPGTYRASRGDQEGHCRQARAQSRPGRESQPAHDPNRREQTRGGPAAAPARRWHQPRRDRGHHRMAAPQRSRTPLDTGEQGRPQDRRHQARGRRPDVQREVARTGPLPYAAGLPLAAFSSWAPSCPRTRWGRLLRPPHQMSDGTFLRRNTT